MTLSKSARKVACVKAVRVSGMYHRCGAADRVSCPGCSGQMKVGSSCGAVRYLYCKPCGKSAKQPRRKVETVRKLAKGDRVRVVSSAETIARNLDARLARVDFVSEINDGVRVLIDDGRVTFLRKSELLAVRA